MDVIYRSRSMLLGVHDGGYYALGHVAESIIRMTDIPVLILHTHGNK